MVFERQYEREREREREEGREEIIFNHMYICLASKNEGSSLKAFFLIWICVCFQPREERQGTENDR
jgi:hypothetical protein